MNPQKKPKSLQDILKNRQQSAFGGREEEIELFQRNLRLPIEDDRHRFIFNIWGQGGVGKTTLVQKFRKIAEDAKLLTVYTDEAEKSVLEVMDRLAQQLEQQGYKLTQFSDRYKVYRQKRQELESDPEAPQGFSTFIGQTAAKTAVHFARQVPGIGLALDLVDTDAVTTQAGEWASYVAKKLTNKDEVRLVQEPIEVLTPLFVSNIYKIAEKAGISLFFDTYERTEEFLDDWLQEILEGRYGELPTNTLIIIAGRHELNKNNWAAYEGVMVRFPLEPFTEEEAKKYLSGKGITNEHIIEAILRLSSRLPLLIATLAAESPDDPNQVGDPSGTAIERFLKWIEDSKRRQVALDAAIPRSLNRDILAQLQGEEEAGELFSWLKGTPFVREHSDGWVYHNVVRSQMLRYKRMSSPQSWAELHNKLANYYKTLQNDLQLNEQKRWRDETWQAYELNVLYHRLCQSPTKYLPVALNKFLIALNNDLVFAQLWARTMVQAGNDVEAHEVRNWAEKLVEGLKAYNEGRYEVAVQMLTALLRDTNLEINYRCVALDWRSYIYCQFNEYSKALEDLTEAVRLAPQEAKYLVYRGRVHSLLNHYEEALKDFDFAIELNPNDPWALANRGSRYRQLDRYEEALKDLDRAIELNPDYLWALANRGSTYRQLERYEEALKDLNRAIELNPDYSWALSNRGVVFHQMRFSKEAFQDLDRALELNPDSAWTLAHRGLMYREMRRYEKALKDLDRALELNPDSAWTLAVRGTTYLMLERYDEAIVDCTHALDLKPEQHWCLSQRALAYRCLNQEDKAQADLNLAIESAKPQYKKDPCDWLNTIRLAFYCLAYQDKYAPVAEKLCQDALSNGVSLYLIHEAIYVLDDFLVLFPEHTGATSIRLLFQSHLKEKNTNSQ
ncbi:tetratricopeptide repeat protein [Scytonema sp. NUACC26]|uniref:tetratricopeptide repeat protein n=1 Tax=Scytonema sp. NUACC26 TaxID=3140176 RepID=UPI0034DC4947